MSGRDLLTDERLAGAKGGDPQARWEVSGYALREEPCTDPYARFCGQTGAAAPSDPISTSPRAWSTNEKARVLFLSCEIQTTELV